jgi:hypothetical protein
MAALLTFLLAGVVAQPQARACDFYYTDKMRDEVVIPTLKENGQKLYWLYGLDKPTVIPGGGEVTLIFGQKPEVDGRVFIIVLDSCTLKVGKAYQTPSTYIFTPSGDEF